jgi:hypothetical protein
MSTSSISMTLEMELAVVVFARSLVIIFRILIAKHYGVPEE